MKRSKLVFIGIVMVLILTQACTQNKPNATNDLDRKVDSVLSLMTLEEKIGQMTLFTSDMDQTGAFIRKEYEEDIKSGRAGAIFNAYGVAYTRKLQEMAVNNTRLGIPLIFGYDVIHGHRTIFPVPLAEAASWDLTAIEEAARIAAIEASAEGLHWTFAPMCDISRDPRWGRIVEGAGEDVYLASEIARARVRGFQGEGIGSLNSVVACVKHYAAYGAPQAGRDYHSVDMSERTLRETFLPPYKAALDEGALTVMTSFNDLNGIPATASKYLMTEILRDEWGFEGFVVTDYTSIMELMFHGVAGDTLEASRLSIEAGVDMDMQAGFYQKALPQLVRNGKVSEELINTAVRRILKVKFMLGLFEDPFRFCSEEREKTLVMSADNLEAARDMARKSAVLLKNENNLLPLSKDLKTIAVIGPMADAQRDMIGSWSAAGDWTKSITLLTGIREAVSQSRIIHAMGCTTDGTDMKGFKEAVDAARQADVVVLALGENYWMSGEAASRADIGLPGVQQELADEILKTGKPIVVVLFTGRPLTINKLQQHAQSILLGWFPGTMGGSALADILFGDFNPSGRLPVTFPAHVGQVPIHYDMRNTGRPFDANNKYTSKYLDVPNEPLYEFGFGLGYTTFEWSELSVNQTSMSEQDSVKVSIQVTNSGLMTGTETVQLYIHDPVASVARPVKQLKKFMQLTLEPGQTGVAEFYINSLDLSFFRADMSFGTEKGNYMIMVGPSSNTIRSAKIELI
jgi:beta-glucosidase